MQHLQHARAISGAKVPGADRPLCRGEPCQCCDVTGGQVLHVDVVAQGCAVGGVVVVAEDTQLLQAAHGDLTDVGQQVVRDA